MGVRARGAGRLQPPPKKKKLGDSVFLGNNTTIWAEGVFGLSNIALMIHIERAHANFVLENEMERIIIDIFGSRTGRDSY